MSAASAAFSSSSLSMRSTSDFNCPAAKPDFAMLAPENDIDAGLDTHLTGGKLLAVSLLGLGELRLLLGRGFFLVAFLPFRGRHSIYDLAGLVLLQHDPL